MKKKENQCQSDVSLVQLDRTCRRVTGVIAEMMETEAVFSAAFNPRLAFNTPSSMRRVVGGGANTNPPVHPYTARSRVCMQLVPTCPFDFPWLHATGAQKFLGDSEK